jgi:predicted TPR repeat methyltransferase
MEYAPEAVDAAALMARIGQLIDQRPGAAGPLLAAVPPQVHPAGGLLLAQLALSDETLDRAALELNQAVNLHPQHSGLRKCRAELRSRLGDMEGAVRDAAEAVILDRTDPFAKALLGELLLLIGRTADAVACLSEAVAAVPDNVVFRQTLAQTLATFGDIDAALATLLEGIRIAPSAAASRNAAILHCIRHRDNARATDLAEQARLDGVADANTFGMQGHALSGLGQHEAAASAYNEALKLAPADAHIRHLAATAQIRSRAPEDFVRMLFDGDADRFEAHIIGLGYGVPALIRRRVTEIAALADTGPVLDLGCGTGLMALALSDLPLGSFSGIDVSPRMLEQARAKGLYGSLRVARLPDALQCDTTLWGLILAADVLCYFAALDEMLHAVFSRLRPGGRFIFSLEELLPNQDGTIPGNGNWASGRLGRHAHSARYVTTIAAAQGYHCLTLDHASLRYEAGGPVAGLLVVLERPDVVAAWQGGGACTTG